MKDQHGNEIPNYFEELNKINVNDKVEKKNGLSYLSWPYAWGELKKHYPEATFTIYENADGWNYHTDGRTCWVKTGVTVLGIEHIEELPIMDFKNKSLPLNQVTSYDVNKTIQRSLTKAVARHGLGLYIYAGEDLPDDAEGPCEPPKAQPKKTTKKAEPKKEEPKVIEINPLTEEELLFLSNRYTGENLEKLLEYFKIDDITQIEPAAGRALIKKIQEQKKKKAEG